MIEGKSSGNGIRSPFGNGKGATGKTGVTTGAHDFVADAISGQKRVTQKDAIDATDVDDDIDEESVAAGGITMRADPPASSSRVSDLGRPGNAARPFKLR